MHTNLIKVYITFIKEECSINIFTLGFGFQCATYCGATRTQGAFFDTWAECFADMIKSLLVSLKDDGRYLEIVKLGEDIITTYVHFPYTN
jgi:hypothetical protein